MNNYFINKRGNEVIYDTGGGAGFGNLTYQTLYQQRYQNYDRTLHWLSSLQEKDLEQEKRQITVKEQLTRIVVKVSREDFPLRRAEIPVEYYYSAAQEAWAKFLSDVCKTLDIQFIDGILERGDKAPIHRVIRLKHGGEYLVRIRENSAVMEVLNTGITPTEISWEVTKDIVNVKKDLAFADRDFPATRDRILLLISQLKTSMQEKELSLQMLSSTKPEALIGMMNQLYLPHLNYGTSEFSVASLTIDYANISSFTKQLDIINLHRLVIECFARLSYQGFAAIVVRQTAQYLFRIMKDLIYETDIMILILQLWSSTARYWSKDSYRNLIFHSILNVWQYHAPTCPRHRIRKPKRLALANTNNENVEAIAIATTYNFVEDKLLTNQSMINNHNNNRPTQQQRGSGSIGGGGVDNTITNTTTTTTTSFINPHEVNPNHIHILSRYGEHFVTQEKDHSSHRTITNQMLLLSRRIDFDPQSLSPITPRMRAKQRQLQLVNELAQQEKIAMERTQRLAAEAEARQQRLAAEAEAKLPKIIIIPREHRPRSGLALKAAQHKEEEEEEEEDDQAGGREQSIVRGTESRPTSGQIRNIQHRQASYQHSSTTQPISPVHSINNNNNTNNSNHTNNSNNSGSKEQQQQRLVFPSLVTASKSSSMTNIPAMSMSSSNTETILLPSQLSSEKKMKKKYTVQIHKPSNHNNNNNNPKTAVANDEDTNHRHKKVWKGTIGELGRRYDPIAAAADYARKNPQKAQVNFKVEIGKQENVEDFIEVTKVDPTTANTNTNNNTNTTITEDEKNVPAKPMSKAEVQLSLPVTSWVVSNPLAQAVEAKLLATASGQSQNQPSAVTTKDTHSAATSSSPTRDGGKGGGRGGGGGSAEAAITTNHTTSTIDIAKVLKKSKKQALVLQPLPDVAIKNFRAFTTSMTTYVVLPQVLATLLRFLTINYGNRDWAFRNGLIQEIAEVILDCVSMPRIFEYFVQLIETLYREGFGDPVDNDYFPTGSNNNNNNHNNHHHNNNINDLEDPSMILSHTSQLDAMTAVSAGGNTTSTVANIVFDAISEMSPPVIDPDVIWEKAPYDEHDEEEAKKKKQKQAEELPDAIIIQKIDQDSVRSINAIAPPTKSAPAATGAGAGTVVDASSAGLLNKTPSNGNNTTHNGDSLKKEEGNNNSKDDQEDEKEEGNPTSGKPSYIRMTFNRHAKKSTMKTNEISVEERTAQGYKEYMKMQSYMVHSELVRDLGEFEFESRYVVCPGESVIVALSITAHHVEVSSKERELAKYWIEFWDTHLREYKVWVRKGQDLSGG
jgi:hypothetical protein